MRIQAWTYSDAPRMGLYWTDGHRPLVYIEGPDFKPQFRRVSDGSADCYQSDTDCYRGKPLPLEHWPQWLLDLDDYGMDVGL